MSDLNNSIKFTKAICLNPNDNIIMSLCYLKEGEFLSDFNIFVSSPISSGQKIAKKNIKKRFTNY